VTRGPEPSQAEEVNKIDDIPKEKEGTAIGQRRTQESGRKRRAKSMATAFNRGSAVGKWSTSTGERS